jgi:hypothetical protein
MKVIQQLIEHFWARGALTTDEAHYLVEHGFITAEELQGYEPQEPNPEPREDPEVAAWPSREVLLPDELDVHQDALEGRPAGPRKRGGRSGDKVPGYELEDLCRDLGLVFEGRAAAWPALVALGRRLGPCTTWQEAAVLIRQADGAALGRALVRALDNRPERLGELWDCVDTEGFHDLLSLGRVCGAVARSFGRLLRAAGAHQFGSAAWLLKGPEVQALANLLQVRRQLLAALPFLYDRHFPRLSRGLNRSRGRTRAWEPLSWGLVLLYNARAREGGTFPPPGYVLGKRPAFEDWRQAWTTALALDPPCVTRFFTRHYGGLRELPEEEEANRLWDVEVYCPGAWKV